MHVVEVVWRLSFAHFHSPTTIVNVGVQSVLTADLGD